MSQFRNVYYNKKEFDKDSLSSSESNPEDHIYEEIDSDTLSTQDEEDTEDNFLLSISRERQRNLKFYGSAGWDFGSVMWCEMWCELKHKYMCRHCSVPTN